MKIPWNKILFDVILQLITFGIAGIKKKLEIEENVKEINRRHDEIDKEKTRR